MVLVTLSLAAAGLAPVVQPAVAAKDIVTIVTEQHVIQARSSESVDLHCPSGADFVGVGFSGVVPPAYLYRASFDDKDPEKEADIYVYNAGRTSRTVTAYGLCLARSVSETTHENDRRLVPKGQTVTATATCPVGTRRIAGGVEIREGYIPPSEITASHSTKRGWTATFRNHEGPRDGIVFAYVSCAYSPRLSVEIVKQTGIWAPTGVTSKSVACPRGMEVAGGGFFVWPFGPHQEFNTVLTVLSSRPETTSEREYWTVRVGNTANGTQQFSVYAVCLALT
jgi:hypothetical protein